MGSSLKSFSTGNTLRLTRAEVQLVPRRLGRRWLVWLFVLGTVATGLTFVLRDPASLGVVAHLVEVNRQSDVMRADLEHARLELQMERATRAELERRVQGLGDEVTRLNQQLEFVNSRGSH